MQIGITDTIGGIALTGTSTGSGAAAGSGFSDLLTSVHSASGKGKPVQTRSGWIGPGDADNSTGNNSIDVSQLFPGQPAGMVLPFALTLDLAGDPAQMLQDSGVINAPTGQTLPGGMSASGVISGQTPPASGQPLPLGGPTGASLQTNGLPVDAQVSGEGMMRIGKTGAEPQGSTRKLPAEGVAALAGLNETGAAAKSGPAISTNGVSAPATPQSANSPVQLSMDMSAVVTEAELVTADHTLTTETELSASLKQDLRTVEQTLTQASRSLSGSHMAALVSRVSEQFIERFNGKSSSFEIRLDPPELGKVDVRVEVGADGKVMAVIAARDPAVVEALMRGAKTLENALTQAGLNLAEGGVQVELDQKHGSGFSGAFGDEFAETKSGLPGPESDPLAEAGDDTTVIPIIESWSRHRLDVTA